MDDVFGTKLSKVASLPLVSERTVQRYTERFQVTRSVCPFVPKNGIARLLSECDEVLV